jgi:hypothetical protein
VERAAARSEVPSAPGAPTATSAKTRRTAAHKALSQDDTDRPAAPARSLEPR